MAILAIASAVTVTVASVMVYRAIDLDSDASSRLRIVGNLLPAAAVANIVTVLVIWRLAAADARRQTQSAGTLQADKINLERQIATTASDLRDSHERLRSVIDSAVDGIVVIDDKGRIEAFNRGAERLFGYPASDVLGRNVNILMPSPYHEEHDGYLSRYLATGSAHIIGIGREVIGRRRSGATFPLHLSVGEMAVAGERKFTGVLHDLSNRVSLEKQLRSSEARWRAIIESAVDGIVVIDAHGLIEAFNPAAERLFGYSEREVCGSNVKMLMPSPYHEEHDHYLARYQATHVKTIIGFGREVTARRKDGSTFPVHLSVAEMVLDGETKFTGILHDLTERTRIEAQLREQAALARLGEMAAVIAHEVKNPLAGIRGAIQIIGGRLPKDSKDAQITLEIVSRIDALNALMKDLLMFARPPQPKTSLVQLTGLIKSTADLLTADPALKGIRVEVEGSAPAVLADPDLLKIVFVNLLVNGAHAMNNEGTLRVGIGSHGQLAEVALRDSGPGIPEDVRARIFTPFFTTKSRGSGLGLPTAKRLVEAHHGSIAIDCPATGGTTVTVLLPTADVRVGPILEDSHSQP
jgi:two-component system sensor kinase FixL